MRVFDGVVLPKVGLFFGISVRVGCIMWCFESIFFVGVSYIIFDTFS